MTIQKQKQKQERDREGENRGEKQEIRMKDSRSMTTKLEGKEERKAKE
jgi:hypothetical protein